MAFHCACCICLHLRPHYYVLYCLRSIFAILCHSLHLESFLVRVLFLCSALVLVQARFVSLSYPSDQPFQASGAFFGCQPHLLVMHIVQKLFLTWQPIFLTLLIIGTLLTEAFTSKAITSNFPDVFLDLYCYILDTGSDAHQSLPSPLSAWCKMSSCLSWLFRTCLAMCR